MFLGYKQFVFNPFVIGYIPGHNYYPDNHSMFVLIYRTIKKHIGQFAIAYSQREVSDKTFGKYLLVDIPGFVGFGKIFEKVSSDQVLTG